MRNNCDIIHAADLDTLLPSVLVKCIKKKKLAYIIYDLYGGNFENYYISRILSKIEKFAIRFADVLFLVDEDRYEQVKGAKINKLAYIYNSPEDYYPTVRSTSNLKSEFIIFYAGYIGRTRGLEEVIDAVKDLAGVKFIIAGIGPDKDIIEQKVANLDSILYIGLISYEEVIKRISDADILFAFYDPKITNNRYASPNKLFEAMMCGKPIIVNTETSAAKIVEKENCGLVVPYGDIDAIKEAIIKLKNNPSLRQKLGENGRKAYEERYSWATMEGRLIDAYTELENCQLTKRVFR
jgi:glycosyltransferase involved in cell wall biosynthesis